MKPIKRCSVVWCDRPKRSAGLCASHYLRKWKGLSLEEPFYEPFKSVAEVLQAKTKHDSETGCLVWQASVDTHGYGHFSFQGKLVLAHRAAYKDARGSIAEGMVVDHLCRVRRCVNPDHMEIVTAKENTARQYRNGVPISMRTHCKHGHELTPENTRINKGYKECRECQRRSERAYEISGRRKVCA